jgi:hypothetical protein
MDLLTQNKRDNVLEITNMQRVIMHKIPAKLRNTP